MPIYKLPCLSLVVALACACGGGEQVTRLESDLCKSLVIRTTNGIDDNVICVLPSDTSALNLVPLEVFGAAEPLTLSARLRSLPSPTSIVDGTDGTEFTFEDNSRHLVAICLEGSGPYAGKCYWELRSLSLATDLKLHSLLLETIEQLARVGVTNSNIDLIPDKPTTAPGSSVHLKLVKGQVTEARWTDPFGTMGVVPQWATVSNPK